MSSKKNILSYGEVIWDRLPSEKKPGGAPMNVAFHVQQLGTSSRIISRIGNDAQGQELMTFFHKKNMNTSLLQQDNDLPTGSVEVTLDINGTPRYEIMKNVAWDNIQLTPRLKEEAIKTDALIFGSLACRTSQSQQTLFELLDTVKLRIFDINLRPPFYSKELLEQLLHYADIAKVNEEELEIVAEWIGNFENEIKNITAVKNRYNINLIIVTKGTAGVTCIANNGLFNYPIYPIKVKDTVGSGDAFLAGFIHQYLNGENIKSCLELAVAMGAIVSSKVGATPTIYKSDLEEIIQKNLNLRA